MSKRLVLWSVCVALLAVLCGGSALGAPLRLVATTGMIGDAVRAVAGEDAEVTVLMGAGVDPHLYAPTRQDVAAMLAADVIFANGLHLEGKLTEVFERASSAGRTVVLVGEAVPSATLREPDGDDKPADPHVWMDPTAWAFSVAAVHDALTELRPREAERFSARADAYLSELSAIDAYAERVLSTVPPASRVLVTAHDAFGYFGARYGFEVVGIQGISTESEAGVRDIENLVDVLVDRRIGAVFVESSVPERHVRALLRGAGARGHTVRIGGELFSDAMGDAGTYEGTFIGMLDHNATVIARALGGEAPEAGYAGRLGGR